MPWHTYACTVWSICFDGNPESVFLKSTKFCFFIVVCVAFSLLYVQVTGSHLLSSVPSHLLYNKRGTSATEETLLICLFFHRPLVLLTLLFSKLAFPFFHMFHTSCVLLQFLIRHSWRITSVSKKKHLITGSWHSFWKKWSCNRFTIKKE